MSKINDVNDEAIQELVGDRNYSAAGLAINAGSAATFKSASSYLYTVDGVFKRKNMLSAQAFSAGHAVQAIGETGYYVVGLDVDGNVTTYQGIGHIPDVPNGITPVGLIKLVATSAAFTPGTSALDLAGTTDTYYDIAVLPSVAP